MAIISLHYYFPWALCALAKWSLYCVMTGRAMRLDQEIGRWYAVADDPDASWDQKLAAYRGLVDDYYEADRFAEFCATHLAHAEDCMATYVESPEFDAHLVAASSAPSHPTSTSSSSPTTAACWPPGCRTNGRRPVTRWGAGSATPPASRTGRRPGLPASPR